MVTILLQQNVDYCNTFIAIYLFIAVFDVPNGIERTVIIHNKTANIYGSFPPPHLFDDRGQGYNPSEYHNDIYLTFVFITIITLYVAYLHLSLLFSDSALELQVCSLKLLPLLSHKN